MDIHLFLCLRNDHKVEDEAVEAIKKLKDLSGEGKVTKKDVLIGRGVIESPLKQTVKDSCYKKVKASYDVFPSAYASGAIAKCRKAKSK